MFVFRLTSAIEIPDGIQGSIDNEDENQTGSGRSASHIEPTSGDKFVEAMSLPNQNGNSVMPV